jgi:pantoate--beta-alanine ligase
MIVCDDLAMLRAQITRWKQAGLRVGFVPTMGNLHAGHLSLIRQAKVRADKVVSSVFVNPLQFGPDEDFERYPRTLDADAALLRAEGCDVLFAPDVTLMYPESAEPVRVCAPSSLTDCLEGAARPGHFDGVTTVVAKLFNMVQPDVAVFGQKDYQQWRVLSAMVAQLNWPIEMVKAPIVRAEDGLALSSRNQYLSASQRQIAPQLLRVLESVVCDLSAGEREFRRLERQATARLLAAGFDQVDYVSIVDAHRLTPACSAEGELVVLAVARLGTTRLLDNIEWSAV